MNKDRVVYALPRGVGKTFQAIKLAEQTNAQIVCFSTQQGESIKTTAAVNNRKILPPIGIHELRARRTHKGQQYIIEDIDSCLCSLLDIEVDSIVGITITTEDTTGN